MDQGILILALSALGIGAFHAFIGPDHYLPFVAMAQTRKWSRTRTFWVVSICGVGHVLSSILLGFVFIAVGYALDHFQFWEGRRGDLAAWLLFLSGIGYTIWAMFRLARKKKHGHTHFPNEKSDKNTMTFWILFTVFLFGPCEPLAALLYTASEQSTSSMILIALLFALSTICVMIIMTFLLLRGFKYLQAHKFEKYQHIIAGITLALCGAGILFLGL